MDTLVRKFTKYHAEEKERKALVDKLSQSASAEDLELWEQQRLEFERDRMSDPAVADAFFELDLVQGSFRASPPWIAASLTA